MISKVEYALLSATIYNDARGTVNQLNSELIGWSVMASLSDMDGNYLSSGLSVDAFVKGNDIVIALKGTDFLRDTNLGQTLKDGTADLGLGLGIGAQQLVEAAMFYLKIKKENPGANITFTGHSLGAGLASILSVWFNERATVYAEAPFEFTASNSNLLDLIQVKMILAGFSSQAFDAYAASPSEKFAEREPGVTGYYVKGEILNTGFLGALPHIVGQNNMIDVADSEGVPADKLHSIVLHSSLLISEQLRLDTFMLPTLLARLFDESLYTRKLENEQADFLTTLLKSQMAGNGGYTASGRLSKFAEDMQALGTDAAGLTKAAQNALIAQGIEWYFWQGDDYVGQNFFTKTSGLLQYTTAAAAGFSGADHPASNRAVVYAEGWLAAYDNQQFPFPSLGSRYAQWNVVTTAGGAVAAALDSDKTQIFVGQDGADNFTGGASADLLLGGGGDDTLDGGDGSDRLFGGQGNDNYVFSGNGWGEDIITDDSAGDGRITIDGVMATGGKKVAGRDGVWRNEEQGLTFTLVGSGATQVLMITKDDNRGSIRIQGWQNAQLGLTMDDTSAEPPAISHVYNGDQRAKVIAFETQFGVPASSPLFGTYAWNETSRGLDGNLVGGVKEADFADVIYASGGDDQVYGFGGNDALDGGAGDDHIEGGDGDDLIAGGTGSDTILGGAGNDYINSSGSLNVFQRLRPDDSWSPPGANEVKTRGPGWGIYLDTQDGEPVTVWSGSDLPAGDDGDYVDAGAGDDQVIAAAGSDYVLGGSGDDQIDGMGGNDVLKGGDGKDKISGDGIIKTGFLNTVAAELHGADYLDGGAGADDLIGGGGSDMLYGGADNDRMWGDVSGKTGDKDYVALAYHGDDYMDGEDGDDYMEGGGHDDTLYGGDGNDNMWGDTSADNVTRVADNAQLWGSDYLDGEGGDDKMSGGGGADTLFGGDGDDALWGDESNAALAGEYHGDDYLDGEAGNDQLVGGGGNDILYGGDGNDTLLGDDALGIVAAQFQGSDYLDGGAGNDYLDGGGADDVLMGGDGDDYLDGGSGADYMAGGAGNDTYIVDDEADVVFEEDSPVQASMNSLTNGASAVTAAAGSVDAVQASSNFSLGYNIENLTLTGTADLNGWGNALDNQLIGNAGANRLVAGNGNDYIDGGAGADSLIGGAGNDFYTVDNTGDAVVELASEGTDVVVTSVSYALADNVEQLQATGTDAVALTGNTLANSLFGNSGNNLLTGAAGDDYLVGRGGDDVYIYNRGDGNDTIDNTDVFSDSANPAAAGATDTLRFGAGISDTDVVALRSGDHLVFKVKGATDQIVIANYYGADQVSGTVTSDHKIDKVEFANGVAWDQAMIATMAARAASNHTPVVSGAAPALRTRAGTSFSYTLAADLITDADAGDVLTYRVTLGDGTALPSWLSFDAATRTLSGVSAVADIGALQLVLWANDSYGAGTGASLTLTVAAPQPPVLSAPLADQSASRGEAFSYVVPDSTFYDPDQGDVLTYTATLADGSALPSWLVFDAATRSFSGTPPALGTLSVRIQASDTASLSAADVFELVVQVPAVVGTAGADVLYGTADSETIRALAGDDVLYGLAGDDTLIGGAGNDTLDGGAGNDQLVGGAGDDTYLINEAGDSIVELAGEGVDTVHSSISTTLADQVENLLLLGGADLDGSGNALANQLVGNGGANRLAGMAGDDVLEGGAGNDLLDGGAGNDAMAGGRGDDVYLVDASGDSVLELAGEGDDTVRASVSYALTDNVENLVLEGDARNGYGNTLDNHLVGNGLDNYLDGGIGADLLEGGAGNDTYIIDSLDDRVVELAGGGVDEIYSTISYTLAAGSNVETLMLGGNADLSATGNDDDNVLLGNGGNSVLSAGLGNDTLQGGQGNDVLDGGAGADYMYGYTGDDTFIVDEIGDVVSEGQFQGLDTVRSSISYVLTNNVENLALTGGADLDGTGNDENNVVTGNSGNNHLYGQYGSDTLVGGAGDDQLDGGQGSDIMMGGQGNDIYQVNSYSDVVIELAGEGVDTVLADASFALSDNIENLELGDGAYYGDATGNALDNHLVGNSYGNRLDGGAGNDVMEGGDGDDVYVFDTQADQAVELAGGGFDTIEIGVSYTLTQNGNIEGLVLTGVANLDATGNTDANELTGNAGNNRLDGGLGGDAMAGGEGDDTYLTDQQGDFIREEANGGNDTEIRSYNSNYYLADNVENLVLTGTVGYANGNDSDNVITGNGADNTLVGMAGNDTLLGGAGADFLIGSEGADLMVGGAGGDYYDVDDAADVIVENVGEGDDFVSTTVSWTLGANVERVQASGSADVVLTGNALDNGVWGNAGSNVLTGGLGTDYLSGGRGNDVYVFNRGDGHDTIDNTDLASATDTLRFGAGITANDVQVTQSGSNLFFTIKGSGDQIALLNYFAANTSIDGQSADAKIDRVEFASGVVWDQAAIKAVLDRAVNNTPPTVNTFLPALKAKAGSAFSYTVAANTVIDADAWDSITYSIAMQNGSAVPSWLKFDPLTRVLSGTPAAANVGELKLLLWGTDTYNASAGEVVTLTVGVANRAPVLAAALADQAVEPGNAFAYTVPAGAFSDADADALSYTATLADGGALPSWLLFNAATRAFSGTPPGNGVTSVKVTASDGYASTADNFDVVVSVQDKTLNGTANADTLAGGAGNDTLNGLAGNDKLTGGAGNDVLNGGAGNDTMLGGVGDDTYVVDSASDVVTELAGEGSDLVQSSVTLTLAANVENLTLTGTTALNGTGNASNNVLVGNAAANTLTGAAGNDTLDGGAGADTLAGGAGNDMYRMGRGYGADIVQENDATTGNTDTLQFLSGIATDQIWLRKVSNDLEVSIIGTSDKATLSNWYLGSQYHVEQLLTSDGKTLLDSQVQNLVSAMAAFAPPAAGQTALPANYASSLNTVIAANWH